MHNPSRKRAGDKKATLLPRSRSREGLPLLPTRLREGPGVGTSIKFASAVLAYLIANSIIESTI